MYLLQDIIPGLWEQLANHGLVVLLLGVAVYVLWKRDTATNDRINKYLAEDRAEMLQVIRNNTEILERLSESIRQISGKYQDFN